MRTIRSFVRRAGRLTAPQQGALVELWPIYGIELKEELLDLDEIFGRRAERVLDIGFGNGDALIFSTQENPEQDFIGIEVHKPGMGHCLLMARASGISNLRLIQHDAVEVLQNQIPNGAIKRINLLFPDPWPKKRHHKRRLLQEPFVNLAGKKLRSGGTFHIATDWSNYAEQIDEVMNASNDFKLEERQEHTGDRPLDRQTTKFEIRGLSKGHRIWDWKFVRLPH